MTTPRRSTTPAAAGAGAGGSELLAAWAVPAIVGLVVLTSVALWTGAGLASTLTGHGWPHVPLSGLLVVRLAREGGLHTLWPAVSPTLAVALAVAVGVGVLVPVVLMAVQLRSRSAALAALRSLARPGDVAPMLPAAAAAKARTLRPSLHATARGRKALPVRPADAGLQLGALLPRGPVVRASWEDVLLAVMAPRSGKTTSLAIPMTLQAPGPVVLTSNKSDAWQVTRAPRAERGVVWTFDPQRIGRAAQSWAWDPIADLHGVEDAERLAGHFVLQVEDDRQRDIWGPAAAELLAALFLAAHLDGADLATAYGWLQSELDPTAVVLLEQAGYPALARSLRGTMQAPAETRGSVLFTARTATRCLRDPQITAWTTPQPGLTPFRPEQFVTSTDTLYLLSKDGGGSAAPLVAALTDRVLRCAVLAAEDAGHAAHQADERGGGRLGLSGRLDPPLVAVLDEAANICRIADLPQLYSHLGSRGVVPVTILQSYAQGEGVWGKGGMRALWSAATVKLLGAGLDDASFVEDVSRLVGDHDVPADSWSSGGGKATRTRSTRRDRILTPAELRALPKGTALLLATGTRAAMLRLLPYYDSPSAHHSSADDSTTARQTRQAS